jgi:hypothetical protein
MARQPGTSVARPERVKPQSDGYFPRIVTVFRLPQVGNAVGTVRGSKNSDGFTSKVEGDSNQAFWRPGLGFDHIHEVIDHFRLHKTDLTNPGPRFFRLEYQMLTSLVPQSQRTPAGSITFQKARLSEGGSTRARKPSSLVVLSDLRTRSCCRLHFSMPESRHLTFPRPSKLPQRVRR